MEENKKIKIDPIKLIIVAFVLVGLGLLGYSLFKIFRGNPYGNEIKIDNFSEVFPDAPENTRFAMFASLYSIIEDNAEKNGITEIPKDGAIIRQGSSKNEVSEDDLHVGSFIVDIKEIRQSYKGYFEWSNSRDSKEAPTTIASEYYSCLDIKDLIYDEFECKDMFSEDTTRKYPIVAYLPTTIEYYSNNYSSYTKYRISYELSEDEEKITIIITDYSGGNYEKALNKIKEFGFSSEDYTIKYIEEIADAPGF